MYSFVIYLLAGWSGFFVMGLQLLGGRLLAPYFGNSIYVWGALITVFMLALSIGYLLGGRLSLYKPSLRRLGIILVLEALAVSPLLVFGNSMLEAVSASIQDPRFGSLVGSAVLFFIPTIMSGMVSPYAIRLLIDDRATSGRNAGQLYFVSTFGSATGTIMTSFYLVLWMEVNHILITMIAISCTLGAIGYLMPKNRRDE